MQFNPNLNEQAQDVILSRKILKPTNTSRVFHVETTWKWTFPRHFNLEYTWFVCNSLGNSLQ